jgi:2-polyprenyl-3-methyl-5-hydroxy-6-metoxy-1,4-benzoquinol methylase
VTAYVERLVRLHRENPEWQEEHRGWVRRFRIAGAVLDAGSGLGHLARACDAGGAVAIAVELDRALVVAGRCEVGRVRVAAADVCALPFRSGSFDWVLSNQVVEHVARPEALLLEARRVLRPGGRLLLTTPNRRAHLATRRPGRLLAAILGRAKSDPTHLREFIPSEIAALVERAAFTVEVREAIGRHATSPFLARWFAGGVLIVARAR